MVFSSLTFLYLFLALCLVLYFAIGNTTARNIILLVFSLFFYAWGEPKHILLMLATTLVDYAGGLLISKFRGRPQAKFFTGLTAAVTLLSLAFFKYSAFFRENLNAAFSLELPVLRLALPVGISFYTFQALTYVVDVYRGRVGVQRAYWKLLLYVSMFPQLIAGPIVRYGDVEAQIGARTVTAKGASAGVLRFSSGLLKKAILANLSGGLVVKLIGGDLLSLTAAGAWVGILAYGLQIYFDFSGYSDMAIGLGLIFGFRFPENFNYPYAASSVSDFWRRWHMTLTSFFRDYLYIPLGGNRKRWAFNMLAVWLLTGLWHGASWNFVLWGLYYFFFLMLEKIFLERPLSKCPAFFRRLYTLAVVAVGWVFFYFEDLSAIRYFFKAAFGAANGLSSLTERTLIVNHSVLLAVGAVACLPLAPRVKKLLARVSETRAGAVAVDLLCVLYTVTALIVSTAAIVGGSYNPFLYFRF